MLRLYQIRDFETSPKITDVCMNMGTLKSLMDKGHARMTIEVGNKCVTIKHHTNRSLGAGPSLTLGENGGFQWLGSPNDVSESLSSMFDFMNNNMRS